MSGRRNPSGTVTSITTPVSRSVVGVGVWACVLLMAPPRGNAAWPAIAKTHQAPEAAPSEKGVDEDTMNPHTATAVNPAAEEHYARGLALYAARDYAAAAAELQKGYAIEPRPELLFAQAQARRLSGDCPRAITLYQQFIEAGPTPVQLQAARLGLDRCGPERSGSPRQQIRSTAEGVAPPPVPSPASRAPALREPDARPPTVVRRLWWHDPWTDVSLGAGVVALGLAAGFEIASAEARDQARDQARSSATSTELEFGRLWDSARQRREIAVGALIGGAVLLAAGGARLLLLRRATPDTAPPGGTTASAPRALAHLRFSVDGGGLDLSWGSTF